MYRTRRSVPSRPETRDLDVIVRDEHPRHLRHTRSRSSWRNRRRLTQEEAVRLLGNCFTYQYNLDGTAILAAVACEFDGRSFFDMNVDLDFTLILVKPRSVTPTEPGASMSTSTAGEDFGFLQLTDRCESIRIDAILKCMRSKYTRGDATGTLVAVVNVCHLRRRCRRIGGLATVLYYPAVSVLPKTSVLLEFRLCRSGIRSRLRFAAISLAVWALVAALISGGRAASIPPCGRSGTA